ncbi:hypothetical protein [Nostoc sp. CHAB 5715]|nr:hypothetical protein [Nostoc sp. CHAB 5715]
MSSAIAMLNMGCDRNFEISELVSAITMLNMGCDRYFEISE